MTGGITQQPALLAAPDKLEDSLNLVPLPETGLSDRDGTVWRTLVVGTPTPKSAFIPVNFGGDDRYLAVVQHEYMRVFTRTGVEIPIHSVTRDANGNLSGGGDPDFSYLNLRRRQKIVQDPELFSGWTRTGGAQVRLQPQSVLSPLGFFDDGVAGDNPAYYEELTLPGGGAAGDYVTAANLYLWSGIRSASVYVNTDVTVAENIDRIGLILQDPSEGIEFLVEWDFGGVYTTAPTVVTNASNFITFTETLPATAGAGNHFRLGFVFDPDKVAAPVTPGNVTQIQVRLDQPDPVGLSGINVWGALLAQDHDEDTLPEYIEHPEILRTVAAAGTTFVANPLEPTRLDTTVTSRTFAEVYGTLDFDRTPAHPSGYPGVENFSVADAGYIFIRLGQESALLASAQYALNIVCTGGAASITIPITVTPGASDGTEDIAQQIADLINADEIQNDHNNTQVIEAFAFGSVVQLLAKDDTAGGGETWEITSITSWDSYADQAISGFTDTVDDISDLPTFCQDGHVVKVLETSDDAENRDDFQVPQLVLRFEANKSTANNPTTSELDKGRWVEGTDYGVRTTLDASSLPHAFTRRRDLASPVVTGQSSQVFFEFAPHVWDDRLVGGDLSNPVPSFLTPEVEETVTDRFITGLTFYRNRLGLAAGMFVQFSEAFLYGNFWRSSLKALADSDRVDTVASTPDASNITDVVTASGQVFFRSDRSILSLAPSQVFGPRTAGLDSVFGDGTGALASGEPASGGIFVPGDGDDHGGVLFLTQASRAFSSQQTPPLEDFDVSAEVSRLLTQDVATLSWGAALKSLFVHARSDLSKFYGLRFIPREGGQIAWYPCDLNGSDIHSIAAISGDLFVLVERGDGLHIESIALDEYIRDAGQDWRVRLDRRITEQDLNTVMTYAGGPDETTITLPYTITSGATVLVCHRDGADYGVKLTVKSATGTTVVLDGDHTGDLLYIGETFTSEATPMRPVIRNPDGSPVTDEVLVRDGEIMLSESGYAQAIVVDPQGNEIPEPATDQETATAVSLRDFRLPFSLGAEDADTVLKIRNTTQKPMNIVGMEWRVDVEHSGTRR